MKSPKNLEEIWQDIHWNEIKLQGGIERLCDIHDARTLYDCAKVYRDEIKRLHRVLIDEGLGLYDKDGNFLEYFNSEEPTKLAKVK